MRRVSTLALLLLLLLVPGGAAQEPAGVLQEGAFRFEYWPRTERLARALAAGVSDLSFPGIPAGLPHAPPIRVQVAPDEATFRALTRGAAPDWGAGVAMPREGLIVLPGYGSDRGGVPTLRQVLRHEIAHVLLQRRLGEARVPRWFTEGYAVWSAGQLDEEAAWLLRLAFVFDRAPPLDSLELGWPAGEMDARVAYLLSATAVEYLHSLGSTETFERLLDQWAEQGRLEPALREVYRLSSAQFERLWRREVKRRFGWLAFLTHGTALAVFFGLIATALFLIRRRRDRERLAQLRAHEPPDQPAYWIEEPPAADAGEVQTDEKTSP